MIVDDYIDDCLDDCIDDRCIQLYTISMLNWKWAKLKWLCFDVIVVGGNSSLHSNYQEVSHLHSKLLHDLTSYYYPRHWLFTWERIMNKSQAGRKSDIDCASRSIAKALIWRLFVIFNTLTAALLLWWIFNFYFFSFEFALSFHWKEGCIQKHERGCMDKF